MVGGDDTKLIDKAPEGRGFTIAITPTADLPAPATEITLSGNIRTLALWGKTKVTAGGASASDSDFDLAARGTLDIRSRTDTAVGQVRTRIQIRNQFSTFNFNVDPASPIFRVRDDWPLASGDRTTTNVEARLAFGEWDFMPGWTLLAGHAAQIATVTNVAYPTQPAMFGLDNTRHNQIRLTYSGGPISFGVGIENPSQDDWGLPSTTTVPDFAGFAQFNAPGGISLRVTGEAGKVGDGFGGNDTGYLVGLGAAASLAQINLNAGFVYTKGLGCDGIFSAGAFGICRNAAGQLAKGYGTQVNAGMGLTETVSANASFGYFNYTNLTPGSGNVDHGYSIGGNIVWQPVEALRVAAEVDYFNVKDNTNVKAHSIVGGLGFWFFF